MRDNFVIGKVYVIKNGNFGSRTEAKKVYIGSRMKCTYVNPYRFQFLKEEWEEKGIALRKAEAPWEAKTELLISDVEAIPYEEAEGPYLFP